MAFSSALHCLHHSLGHDCVYLMGGPTRDTKPVALRLHSGDIVVMTGQSRECFHSKAFWINCCLEESFSHNFRFTNFSHPLHHRCPPHSWKHPSRLPRTWLLDMWCEQRARGWRGLAHIRRVFGRSANQFKCAAGISRHGRGSRARKLSGIVLESFQETGSEF